MKFFLYAPSLSLGGTETLALRIAEELMRKNVATVIVSEKGGWLYESANKIGIEAINPEKFSSTELYITDVVFASAKYLNDINLNRHESQTVFWLLHPLEFVWTQFKRVFRAYEYLLVRNCGFAFQLLSPVAFKKLQDTLKVLSESNRIISMSRDCNDFTNFFLRTSYDIPTIPLPIPKSNSCLSKQSHNRVITGVAYFGRIEQFKVTSIKRLISDYSQCMHWQNKTLILFGYGEAEAEIHSFAKSYGINIEITGKLTTKEVVERAYSENLVVFTMGLSGLDLLSADVPSVFLPVPRSARDAQGNYSFLSYLPDGCLGSYPEFLNNHQGKTFEEITEICQNESIWNILDNDKEKISLQHDLSIAVDRLLTLAKNSGLCRSTN